MVIHLKVFTHKQREDEEGLFQLVNNPTKVSLHLFDNTEGFVVTEPFLFRLFFFLKKNKTVSSPVGYKKI